MNSCPVPSCAERVAGIAEALCRAVGHALGHGLLQGLMALLIWRRIQRVRGMLLALESRFLAGRLGRRQPQPKPGAGPALRGGDDRVRLSGDGLASGSQVLLPRGFAWLCTMVPGEAACFAGQLRVALAEPGMVALLAACPQAVRVVRPLCWMLGIERDAFMPGVADAPALDIGPPAKTVSVLRADVVLAGEGPALRAADEGRASRVAEVLAGMGWVRSIPG